MDRIQMLISQIDYVNQMMTVKLSNERAQIHDQLLTQIDSTFQKVSLAEKNYHVKNACSPISREID